MWDDHGVFPHDATTTPGASWHPDPLSAAHRLRWWGGAHWTAWVVGPSLTAPFLAWRPELADLPFPIRWGTATLRVAEAPRLEIKPVDAARTVTVPVVEAAPRRRRRRHAVLLAAALPLLLAGAASAALLAPHPLRPSLATVGSYHDTRGRFALTYPSSWRVEQATPGTGVELVVGASAHGAVRSTVSVTVGTVPAPLPPVAELARTATADVAVAYPGVELTSSAATTLAAGPAWLLQFTDPPTAISVEQIVGRTADDRPLTVTVVVPDARAAPSSADVRAFVASIVS